MPIQDQTEPDWEILNLLREVRRRVRSSGAQGYLARLNEEPRWLSALPPAEARFARTMLEATREVAISAQWDDAVERAVPSPPVTATAAAAAPRRRRAR